MKLRAISGLHPTSEAAARRLACPPYDVVTADSARELLSCGVAAFLRVVRSDATLGPDADAEAEQAASLKALDALQEDSSLARPASPAVYVYELTTSDGHSQRGIAALVSIEDYAANVIRAHEATRKNKEDERAALAAALGAHTGPVLLAYRRATVVERIIGAVVHSSPSFTVDAHDGVLHTVWRASDAQADEIIAAFNEHVPLSYIADGHHRAASAARVGFDRRAVGGTQMARESDWFPAVLFPDNELRSKPYYRLLTVGDDEADAAWARITDSTAVSLERLQVRPDVDAPVGTVYAARRDGSRVVWYALSFSTAPNRATTVDAQLLQDHVLKPAFGIHNPRTDPRVDFVGGINLAALEAAVGKRGCIAFAPGAVDMESVMRVVDSGHMMPPKSTWFEPKLASGLFIQTF